MDVAVVGAGVVGLTAAIALQQRGHRVAILARDLPKATTSAVAAAIWYPYLAEPRDRVLRWSTRTFATLAAEAAVAAESGAPVRMQEVVEWFADAAPDVWWRGAVPDVEPLPADRIPPGYRSGIRARVPVCDTRRYLPWLARRFTAAGGTIERRDLRSLDAAFAHTGARAVVNCSGLGARELCGDDSVVPVRGQVAIATGVHLPFALIDDTGGDPVYAVPRGDGAAAEIVLGGTAQHGDSRRAPDPAATERIVRDLLARLPQLAGAAIRSVRVGLRPFRPTVRLECERRADGRLVVHDYGHGGSGYTLCWGCAEDVAQSIQDHA